MDEFLLDPDEESEEQQPTAEESKPFTELRKHARKLEKALKERETELDELRRFRQEREQREREQAIATTFEQVGLNPKHARLFAALNPNVEPTTEVVAQFAQEHDLVTGDAKVPEPQPAAAFAPTLPSGGAAPTVVITDPAEAAALAASDPARFAAMKATGQIRLGRLPGAEL
jgi:hypothetical protein